MDEITIQKYKKNNYNIILNIKKYSARFVGQLIVYIETVQPKAKNTIGQ